MFTELSGENPTYDTMNSVSKLYEILINGGSTITMNVGFILMNTMISERFGLKNRRIDLPVQLSGLFYIYPDNMLLNGFDGDTLRKLAAAEENSIEMRRLALIVDSPDVYRQKRSSLQQEDEEDKLKDIKDEKEKSLIDEEDEIRKQEKTIEDLFKGVREKLLDIANDKSNKKVLEELKKKRYHRKCKFPCRQG